MLSLSDLNDELIEKIDSATKYPSIPTYHTLNPKDGTLLEERISFPGEVVVTEKIDGTNGRIIFLPSGEWIIGSRKELLHAQGDRIYPKDYGIVRTLRDLGNRLKSHREESLIVVFAEVYGAEVRNGFERNYSVSGITGYRVFDVAEVPLMNLDHSVEKIAAMREAGVSSLQSFFNEDQLDYFTYAFSFPRAPRIAVLKADELPETVDDTHAWLKAMVPNTFAALDRDHVGKSEGVVVRTIDRKAIAKIKFENYLRTERVRNKGKK